MGLLEETLLHESSGLTKSPGDGAKLDQGRSVSSVQKDLLTKNNERNKNRIYCIVWVDVSLECRDCR